MNRARFAIALQFQPSLRAPPLVAQTRRRRLDSRCRVAGRDRPSCVICPIISGRRLSTAGVGRKSGHTPKTSHRNPPPSVSPPPSLPAKSRLMSFNVWSSWHAVWQPATSQRSRRSVRSGLAASGHQPPEQPRQRRPMTVQTMPKYLACESIGRAAILRPRNSVDCLLCATWFAGSTWGWRENLGWRRTSNAGMRSNRAKVGAAPLLHGLRS